MAWAVVFCDRVSICIEVYKRKVELGPKVLESGWWLASVTLIKGEDGMGFPYFGCPFYLYWFCGYYFKRHRLVFFLVALVEGEIVFSFPSVDGFVGESTTKMAPWASCPHHQTQIYVDCLSI